MNGFDLSTAQGIYIGNNLASEVWLGQNKIWPTIPPPTQYYDEYLTIESLQNNTGVYFEYQGPNDGTPLTIQWSTDKITWNNTTANRYESAPPYTNQPFVILNTNDKVYIKGTNDKYSGTINESSFNHNINTDNPNDSNVYSFNLSGNIMSLIYGDNFRNKYDFPPNSETNFSHLFEVTAVIDAGNLVLPATTLTRACYYDMFDLCSNLTTAPDLPATTLVQQCYGRMFAACSSLNYIKCLATDISATNCLYNWVLNVSSTGTFVKDANTTWPTGDNGIPLNWTVTNN